MNKTELIAEVAKKAGLTKADAERAVGAFLGTVVATVAKRKDNKVQLIGFGTFEPHKRKARVGKNPQTGDPLKIPATTVPVFKAGKAFKDAVAKKK